MKSHVIICGLGELGFHVFELLERAGIQVAVISNRTHAEWAWQIEKSGGLVFQGDARDDNLLLDAGIQEAKAIIALTNQDRVNLAIAVDAKKLNPNIIVISRIFDSDLGNLVADAFDIQQFFSTSEIAAPVFSNGLIGKHVLGQFCFQNKTFLVYEDGLKKDDDFLLANQGEDSLIAKPVKKIKKKKFSPFKKIYQRFNFRAPIFTFFQRFLMLLLIIILASSFFLAWAMPLSFTDALYFVIATVSSVGYGDINFLKSSDALKYFGCLLMLTGTAIIAILFSSVTEMILLKKIPNIVGGRPIPKKNHVVLIGSNHIGLRIVSSLIDEGIPLVIIENDPNDRYPEDIARQVALVNGNPKSNNTLLRANIKSASAILSVTKDDIENLSISIAAKKINPNITEITQINNTKIGGNLKNVLSLTSVISVPLIAGPYFLAAIFSPKVIFAIEWHNRIIYLSEIDGKMKSHSIPLSSLG
jgi:Trk K+ transport system NAD-binding subunit